MDRNLVDVLDGALRLYAPLLSRLMAEHKVKGISTFIGRAEPSLLARDKEGRGYQHNTMSKAAAGPLKERVRATLDLQASCPLIRGLREPIDVSARYDGKRVVVEVMVSNRLGGLFAKQGAVVLAQDGGHGFLVEPAVLFATTDPGITATQVAGLQAACAHGPHAVAAYLDTHTLLLNGKWDPAHTLETWLAHFPAQDTMTCNNPLGLAYTVTVRTSQQPALQMWVSSQVRDTLSAADALAALERTGLTVVGLDEIEPPADDAAPAGPRPR